MNATKHIPAAAHDERVAFGGYVHDDVAHEVVAIRNEGGAWRLVDGFGNTATVIESFFPDEEPEAVRAVAEMYLSEMRS